MFVTDRQIIISTANSRKSTHWPQNKMYWSELVERIKTPARGTETIEQYLALPKSKQDELKDVGGFVAGSLKDNRRKAGNVLGRDVITLDLDNIPAGGTQDVLKRIEGLGCAYAVYSTRKHEEAKPRLRVLIPCNRTANADEYEPLARKSAEIIGIELCDPSTFEVTRLMYWPSCCSDSQYIYQFGDKPLLNVDGVLKLYGNWKDINEWPQVPGVQKTHEKLAAKQADPLTKQGVVGAFCKIYNVYQAIDTFIPDAYTPCDNFDDRYTFTGGSTVGGAIVYDSGNFLFSHHATDPAGGKLCNAFDLARLHRFGELDDEAKPDTPVNKLPSFVSMCELAMNDANVLELLNKERYENAVEEFLEPEQDLTWLNKLKRNKTTGNILKTISNVKTILKFDPAFKDKIYKDLFRNEIIGVSPMPWGKRETQAGEFKWADDDDSGLREYIEKLLDFKSRESINDALINHANANGKHPIKEYLLSINWDGLNRLDTLLIDYLGAEDCEYARTVTRKAFTAAVARIMTPGCKFDNTIVICGRQGIGKSTLIEKMGKDWFTNSIVTFEGKEAAELIQGVWIVEIGELGAFNKSDLRIVKQFLSRLDDQFRAAYARKTEKHLRQCVFFGTTNDYEYLKDPTGDRRFWPIDAEFQKPIKRADVHLVSSEIDQIWAEAYQKWKLGESLTLSSEMEIEVEKRRKVHSEQDPLKGQIEHFLEKLIPEDWDKWSLDRRLMFWSGHVEGDIKLVERDKICAIELWKECLKETKYNLPKHEAIRINTILSSLEGWERGDSMRFGAEYGKQKGFKKFKI